MAFASVSNELKIHTWPQLELIHSYKPRKLNDGSIKNIAYAKDGTLMVLVPEKASPEIFALKNSQFKLLHTITSIDKITWATFSNTTKKYLGIGTAAGNVMIYDIKNKKQLKTFPNCNSGIYKIEYAFKDNNLISGCDNGDLIVYSNRTNIVSSTIRHKLTKITTFCCLNEMAQVVCSGNENGTIKLWDIHKNKEIISVDNHFSPIKTVISPYWLPDLVISISTSNNLCIYNVKSNQIIARLKEQFLTADFCTNSQYLVCGNSDGIIAKYDLRNLARACNLSKIHNDAIKQVVFQKNLKEATNNSIVNITEDAMKTESSINAETTVFDSFNLSDYSYGKTNSKNPIDSFMLSFTNSADNQIETRSISIKDSFMDAFGSPLVLNDVTNNSLHNIQIPPTSTDVKNISKKNASTAESSTPTTRTSSTKYILDAIVESPILEEVAEIKNDNKMENSTQTETLTANMNFTKFGEYMDKYKEELLWEIKHITYDARNTLLSTLIKDTMDTQALYSNLKNDLLSDTVKIYSNSEHIQEIEALKRENILLKRENLKLSLEISNLKK